MKKTFILFFALLLAMISCTSVREIGKVNMISNRNVDPKMNYEAISTYAGGSPKEIRKSRATTVEDAITQTVKKVPGGEFMMNAKIYLVDSKYIAVEGDVWGQKGAEISYRGFKVGDKVTWKLKGKFVTGVITSLKNDKTCLIKDENGEIIEKEYDEISKS